MNQQSGNELVGSEAPAHSFAVGAETASTAVAAQARAVVETRYKMALLRPRNWDQVRSDIRKECSRPSFAHNKSALYRKPIGDGVEGLGIRFAEMALRCMTNVMIETMVIFEDDRKEIHRVIVTDLESNVTYPGEFIVFKTIERSKPMDDGSYISVRLNSWKKPVYTIPAQDEEMLNKRQAMLSKAIRTIGLRIIPGDLQDEAEAIIRKVRLDKAAQDPDAEARAIVDAFAALRVRAIDLTAYLGCDIAQCSPAQLVELRGIYGAIRDGEATWKEVMDNKAQNDGADEKPPAPPAGPKTKAAAAPPPAPSPAPAPPAAPAEPEKQRQAVAAVAETKQQPAEPPEPPWDDGVADAVTSAMSAAEPAQAALIEPEAQRETNDTLATDGEKKFVLDGMRKKGKHMRQELDALGLHMVNDATLTGITANELGLLIARMTAR